MYKYKSKYNNNYKSKYNNNYKRKDNIFILTRDNYYFIIEKKYLEKTTFFHNLFSSDYNAGYLGNPIFLQNIYSTHLKYVIQYLKWYYNNTDKQFNMKNIIMNDLYKSYNIWDRSFIKDINTKYKDDSNKLLELIKTIEYLGINNLYKKIKYYYDYEINNKLYKLDELSDHSNSEYEY